MSETPEEILARLRDIDGRRRALLEELEAADPAWLDAHPLEGKWSILEIVEHLVLAESVTLQRMGDPGAHTPARRSLRDRLMYRVVMFILRSPRLKVRVPTRRMVPGGGRSLAELKETWDENHARLQEMVSGLDREGLERPVAHHKIAGPMTVEQSVRMLDVHLDRHAGQIRERIRLLEGRG